MGKIVLVNGDCADGMVHIIGDFVVWRKSPIS
jgi:hypothetical protein